MLSCVSCFFLGAIFFRPSLPQYINVGESFFLRSALVVLVDRALDARKTFHVSYNIFATLGMVFL